MSTGSRLGSVHSFHAGRLLRGSTTRRRTVADPTLAEIMERHHNTICTCEFAEGDSSVCPVHSDASEDVAILLSTIQDHEGHIENLGFLLTKRTEERDNALIRLSEQQRVIEAVREVDRLRLGHLNAA